MANAYAQFQSVVLDGESAFEELYTRLARWASEADQHYKAAGAAEADYRLERCIELLGYMDRCLDLSGTPEVLKAILALHRFLISALVRAKAEQGSEELPKLVPVFLSMGQIFATIHAKRMAN